MGEYIERERERIILLFVILIFCGVLLILLILIVKDLFIYRGGLLLFVVWIFKICWGLVLKFKYVI